MKKLLSILAIIAFTLTATVTATAQSVPLTNLKKTWGATEASGAIFDTVKTTAAVYLYSGPIWGYKDNVQFTLTATELSGTSGGTATLEVSLDGTNWSSYYNSKDSTYSYTLTDVATAQIYRWDIANWGGGYARIKVVGSGTVSIDIRAKYIAVTRRS